MNDSLYALLQFRFRTAPDKPALVSERASLTYGALEDLAARYAHALERRGVRPGDRVAAQVEKSFDAVGLYLGVLRAGGVYVPLNTGYTPAEVKGFLADCRPRLFVHGPGAEDAWAAPSTPLGAAGGEGLAAEAARADPLDWTALRSADDLAAIVYTSGTTGRSKGAMLTHANLASNALTLHEIWGFEPDDVLLHALPIYHVHGLFIALHTAFLNTSTIRFHTTFDAAAVRADLACSTVLMGVPTFYTRLLATPGFSAADCVSMRLFISGSAPLTEQASRAWTLRTGCPILERYGMSEAGMITSNPLLGDRVPGTVGYALPEVEVRIADDAGRVLAAGEVGVVEVRGPNVFKGYWAMPDATAASFRPDGFFITGDVGFLAGDGRLTLVGRAKDLIISGGLNIYPKEIEDVLEAVPGVSEAAVIAAPHPEMGEGVVAVMTTRGEPPGDAAILAVLTERLARFKHPRRFVFVDELPRNAMGKIQKSVLREQFRDVYITAQREDGR